MNRGRIGRQLSTLSMWETPIFKIHIQRDSHHFQSLLHIFNYQLPFSWMVMTPISVLWKGWALGLKPALLCLIHISTLMWAFWARFWAAASRMVHISRKTLIKNFNQNTRNEKRFLKYRFQPGEKIIYKKIKLHGKCLRWNFLEHLDFFRAYFLIHCFYVNVFT